MMRTMSTLSLAAALMLAAAPASRADDQQCNFGPSSPCFCLKESGDAMPAFVRKPDPGGRTYKGVFTRGAWVSCEQGQILFQANIRFTCQTSSCADERTRTSYIQRSMDLANPPNNGFCSNCDGADTETRLDIATVYNSTDFEVLSYQVYVKDGGDWALCYAGHGDDEANCHPWWEAPDE